MLAAAGSLVDSSPHARGSSHHRACCTGADWLVPARAGVFPRPRGPTPAPPARPRTRGGLPGCLGMRIDGDGSSPHARGSSFITTVKGLPGRLVPARAGVFPPPPGPCGRRCPRPRTRGGLPLWAEFRGDPLNSSPHARGSSLREVGIGQRRTLVPARAGVFPPSTPGSTSSCSRPRTRGGLPVSITARCCGSDSSPHARGSSPCPQRLRVRQRLVPARAGVFRATGPACATAKPRPRTRGGLPLLFMGCELADDSSPHARGSFRLRRAGKPGGVLVPARAGVFHRTAPDTG